MFPYNIIEPCRLKQRTEFDFFPKWTTQNNTGGAVDVERFSIDTQGRLRRFADREKRGDR